MSARARCGLLSLFIDTRRLIRILEAGQNADGVSRDEMSARKRCGLLSLFIDTRGLIRILGAGQNADGVSRGEMSARKRCGLLSLFIDTRGLICILGAGQNADGVSREEMSPGKDVGCCLSLLISDDSAAFWEQAKMQMESPGKKCRQEEMWAAVSLYWYQKTHLHFVSGPKCSWSLPGRNVGQEEMWAAVSLYWYQTTHLRRPKCRWSLPERNVARKRCELLSLFIDTRGLIRILGAGQNADGVSRGEMSARKRCGLLSLFIDIRRLSCILGAGQSADGASRKEMSPGRDVGCCLSLLIPEDSYAFWEQAKMQMESPGKKCRQEKMWAAVSLYWYQTTHLHFGSGPKCRWSLPGRNVGQEKMWAAVSLYWYQTTHLHFGSGPKCRWSLPGRNVARKRCGLLSLFIDIRRLICILGAGQNADGVSREEMSPGRDVGCCLSLLIPEDSYAFWERAKMQMESLGTKCRQEELWAAASLYWYQTTHLHVGSGPKCRWSLPGRNVGQEKMWAAVSLYWYQTTHLHFGSRPKCRWSLPGKNVARKRCGLLSLFIDTRRLIRILGAGQNADGVSRDEMSPRRVVGCCLSLLIPDDSSACWEQAKMQMESPGKKCRQEKMWAAVSLYWYQTTHLHFGSRPKCRWSLPGRNVARKRCGLLSLFIDTRRLIRILGAGQNADGVSREEMSARKRCGLLSLFIDIRRLICILGAGQNADGVSREEMSARKRCGLLSLFIDIRRLICILGAGQNADGVSWDEISAKKRCGLLSFFIDTRRNIRILGAGQNADGVSRGEMSARKRCGLLSLFIDTTGLICILGAGQNADGPSRDEMSPGKDVGCYLSLLIPDDSSAFWERAKMQMESPGEKCRPGKDVGCCLSLLISDDSFACWEQAKMQMDPLGTKCRQEKMWAAVSLYWYQTTHTHFGSGPKCRWSLSGRNVAKKSCGLLSLFIDTRRLICMLGAWQNADGVSREEMSPGKDVGCCLSLLISDDSSAFWEQA